MNKRLEIDVLNFDDLDVEELQNRLETAVAAGATSDSWLCWTDSPCAANCDVVCSINCTQVCDVHCGAVR